MAKAKGAVKSKGAAKAPNRRGSPEAIEKRRAARMFNDVLGGRGGSGLKLDGRTEKRRQRLLEELKSGKTQSLRQLKPLDVLQHVQELLDLGEPLSELRKVAKAPRAAAPGDEVVGVVRLLHKAYRFRAEAYRFVGIGDDVLRSAGVIEAVTARKSRREGGRFSPIPAR